MDVEGQASAESVELEGLPRRRSQRHDELMRMPWAKSQLQVEQLDLVDEASAEPRAGLGVDVADGAVSAAAPAVPLHALTAGVPLTVSVDCLDEDPFNPRTEFPDEEIAELAQDIALRGILQPIVVRRTADADRYHVVFG